jgi:ankyrin repeat protein
MSKNLALLKRLTEAAESGRNEVVKEILDGGFNPNIAEANGRTALMYAAGGGHPETVRLLLNGGANPNAECVDAVTAMGYALSGGYFSAERRIEVVRILLQAGAKLLPGHLAAAIGLYDLEDLKALLSKTGRRYKSAWIEAFDIARKNAWSFSSSEECVEEACVELAKELKRLR